jgi:hypothetical protein
MEEAAHARKIPLIFFCTEQSLEPVREWLKNLPEPERHATEKISCVHNGVGRLACLCAGRSVAAFGRFGQTSQHVVQRAY